MRLHTQQCASSLLNSCILLIGAGYGLQHHVLRHSVSVHRRKLLQYLQLEEDFDSLQRCDRCLGDRPSAANTVVKSISNK